MSNLVNGLVMRYGIGKCSSTDRVVECGTVLCYSFIIGGQNH